MAETTNQPKWTPGPLQAMAVTFGPQQAGKFELGSEHAAVVDDRGHAVALTGPATDERSQADATLYAAAPAMAEALRQITRINGSTGGAAALVREFKFIAEQALAKAEGR